MLPKVDVPIYELKLISQKEPVRFRPFLVKEQKLLMMTQESNEKNAILNTVKQIITNCILSEIDVEDIPLFDIEYLFLNLRARSIGEVSTLNYKCANEIEEGEDKHKCSNIIKFDLDILKIQPKVDENHSNRITINDQLGMVMKYPKLNMFGEFDYTDETKILDLIISCIDSIYDQETIYYTKDSTRKEIEDFVDSLPTTVVDKIKVFFDTMPKVSHDLEFQCNKCGYKETIVLEGLDSFFV
jgi:hypothetical protein